MLPSNDRGLHIWTLRLMGGIYEVSRWDGLRYYDIHTKFHKDWFRHSKANRGETHRQQRDLISLLYFFKIRKLYITKTTLRLEQDWKLTLDSKTKQVTRWWRNSVGLSEGKCVLNGDGMFTKNAQRSAETVCSCDAPCWRAKSWDITGVKGGQVSNSLSGYTETNRIRNTTTVNFVLQNVNKK
jgi:hypothetical protein